MLCSKCNKEIDANLAFCPYCGNQVSVSSSIISNANGSLGENTYSQYNANQGISSDFNKTDNINIGLVILSFLIPLAGLIIFITKKDNEPKTAKTSGICALISFIIGLLAIGIIFSISVFSVNKMIDETKKHVDVASNKIEEIEENINIKKGNVSSDWKDYEVKINDYVLELPSTYTQFANITGFNMKSSQSESNISSNYYSLVNLYKNDKLALYIEILNDTNKDIKIPDGKVTRVWQSKYQISTGADEIIFPGNLKAGIPITERELINMFGEPTKKDNYSNGGYEKITYHYAEDEEVTTTNYYEISIVSGVIDEIILDHRNY